MNNGMIGFPSGGAHLRTAGSVFKEIPADASGVIRINITQAQHAHLRFTGTRTGPGEAELPDAKVRRWWIKNDTGHAITVRTKNGTGLTIGAGDTRPAECDGVNVVEAEGAAIFYSLGSYDFDALPPAIGLDGATVWVLSGATDAPCAAISNGTAWLPLTTGAELTAG